MLGYFVTAGICLGLLVLMPMWSQRTGQPSYPLAVIVLLAVAVVVVPLVSGRHRREGAAPPDEPRD